MKRWMALIGCWIVGLAITAGVYWLASYFDSPLIVFLACVIAAVDAKYARIWRVESALPDKPSQLFFWMLLFGWLFMPWYLATRFKMMAGIAGINKPSSQFPYRFQGRIE